VQALHVLLWLAARSEVMLHLCQPAAGSLLLSARPHENAVFSSELTWHCL